MTGKSRNSRRLPFQVFVTSTDPEAFDPDALKQVENPERPLPRKSFRDGGHDPVKQNPFRDIRITLHSFKCSVSRFAGSSDRKFGSEFLGVID